MVITNRCLLNYVGDNHARCKVQLQKDKSPLAAMTCESTQPTHDATTQYGTFVLAVIQLFAAYNCRKRSTLIR